MQIDIDTADLDRAARHLRLVGTRVSGYAGLARCRAAMVASELGDETGAALQDAARELERAVDALGASYRHYGDAFGRLAVRYGELEAAVVDPDVRR